MTMADPTCLFGEEADDDSFWLKAMAKSLENSITKLPAGKRLLVLGDNDAEKDLLISKLQDGDQNANFAKANGLEYKYLTVKDDYDDHETKLEVWILEGDTFYKSLLRYALDETNLADTTVLLVSSMTVPWNIISSLTNWTSILKNHIERLNLSNDELELRKNNILERFRGYAEPGVSSSEEVDNTRDLEMNLGVEMIVVITRVEYMKELQNKFGYEEEHFDFIQMSLRKFCLSHGAALFYVSVKEDKNCDLLFKYLLHKIYYFPFRIPAILVDSESILIPSGWDTKEKIKLFAGYLITIPPSSVFEKVIFKPTNIAEMKRVEHEITVQSDQEFLTEMQAALEGQAANEKVPDLAKESSLAATAITQRSVVHRAKAQPVKSPPKKIESKIKIASGEGDNTLANFFQSLLNRRTDAKVVKPVELPEIRTYVSKNASENLIAPTRGVLDDSRKKPNKYLHGTTINSSSNAIAYDTKGLKEKEKLEAKGSQTNVKSDSRVKKGI